MSEQENNHHLYVKVSDQVKSYEQDTIEDQFICPCCLTVVIDPQECCSCQKWFCTKCIEKWKQKKQSKCPLCMQKFTRSKKLQQFAKNKLDSFKFQCSYCCTSRDSQQMSSELAQPMPYQQFCLHVLSKCPHFYFPCPNKCSNRTESDQIPLYSKQELAKHLKKDCPNELVECEKCGIKAQRKQHKNGSHNCIESLKNELSQVEPKMQENNEIVNRIQIENEILKAENQNLMAKYDSVQLEYEILTTDNENMKSELENQWAENENLQTEIENLMAEIKKLLKHGQENKARLLSDIKKLSQELTSSKTKSKQKDEQIVKIKQEKKLKKRDEKYLTKQKNQDQTVNTQVNQNIIKVQSVPQQQMQESRENRIIVQRTELGKSFTIDFNPDYTMGTIKKKVFDKLGYFSNMWDLFSNKQFEYQGKISTNKSLAKDFFPNGSMFQLQIIEIHVPTIQKIIDASQLSK